MQPDVHGTARRGIVAPMMSATVPLTPTIFVVDDDDAVRASVVNLLESDGYDVRPFACARTFLGVTLPLAPACLVLDMHMPALDGLDVVAELARIDAGIPVIFLTGFGSIPLSVQAMKAGAIEFLTKPVQPEQLLDAVRTALEDDASRLEQRRDLAGLRARLASLTPRERETMELVIGGLLNKQVADAMGISEIMAKTHKRKVMEKMQARSLPDLVRDAERLQIMSTRHR